MVRPPRDRARGVRCPSGSAAAFSLGRATAEPRTPHLAVPRVARRIGVARLRAAGVSRAAGRPGLLAGNVLVLPGSGDSHGPKWARMSTEVVGALGYVASLYLAAAFGSWRQRTRGDGRHPRRGGYLPPTAYTATNRPTGITGAITRAGSSSSIRRGAASAGEGAQLTLVRPSSATGLGFSGTEPGAAGGGTGLRPRVTAGSGDYCRCGAHVVGTPCLIGLLPEPGEVNREQ